MWFQQDLVEYAVPWFVFEAAARQIGTSCSRPHLNRDQEN